MIQSRGVWWAAWVKASVGQGQRWRATLLLFAKRLPWPVLCTQQRAVARPAAGLGAADVSVKRRQGPL